MIESFLKAFHNSREHWAFWPFVLLIIQIGLYNFLFSTNGYFSYLEKSREREKLQSQIQELLAKKTELTRKLATVKNEDEVIKEFLRKLYRYDDKYIIVKFIDDQKNPKEVIEEKMDLVAIQRVYILISTVILSVFSFLAWKNHYATEHHEP